MTTSVQPGRGVDLAAGIGRRLEGPDGCRPDGDDPAAGCAGRVQARGGCGRDREPLRQRALAVLERRNAAVQDDRNDLDVSRRQRGEGAGVNGRPALGISALPGSMPKIVW